MKPNASREFRVTMLLILLIFALFSGRAVAEDKRMNLRQEYLDIIANDEQLLRDSETYASASKKAIRWIAYSPEQAIDCLNEELSNQDAIMGRYYLLNTLASITFTSAEAIREVDDQLSPKHSNFYMARVMQLRFQSRLNDGEQELRAKFFADEGLAATYVTSCLQPDFVELFHLTKAANISPDAKIHLRGLLLERWLSSEPKQVEVYVKNRPASLLEGQENFVRKWARSSPEEVVEHLAGLCSTDPKFDDSLINALQIWVEIDEFAAIAWVDAQSNAAIADVAIAALIEVSLKDDGVIAAKYFDKVKDEAKRVELAPQLARILADRDPVAGVTWIRDTAPLMDMRSAVAEFYFHLAKYDLAYAVAIYPDDLPVGLQQESVRVILKNAAQTDLAEVFDWMETLSPQATKDYLLKWWFQDLVMLNPERAAAFVAWHPDSRKHHRPHHNVGAAWAAQDPSAAKAWAEGLELGPAKGGAGYGVTEGLLKLNDRDALDWIASLPQGRTRDWAVDSVYDHRCEQRPEVIFELALTVSDRIKKRRRKYLKDSIEAMAAQGTLDTNAIRERGDIPPEDRDWVLSLLPN